MNSADVFTPHTQTVKQLQQNPGTNRVRHFMQFLSGQGHVSLPDLDMSDTAFRLRFQRAVDRIQLSGRLIHALHGFWVQLLQKGHHP